MRNNHPAVGGYAQEYSILSRVLFSPVGEATRHLYDVSCWSACCMLELPTLQGLPSHLKPMATGEKRDPVIGGDEGVCCTEVVCGHIGILTLKCIYQLHIYCKK